MKSLAPLNHEIYELKSRLQETERERDELKNKLNDALHVHLQSSIQIPSSGSKILQPTRPKAIYWGISCFDCSEFEAENIIFPPADSHG